MRGHLSSGGRRSWARRSGEGWVKGAAGCPRISDGGRLRKRKKTYAKPVASVVAVWICLIRQVAGKHLFDVHWVCASFWCRLGAKNCAKNTVALFVRPETVLRRFSDRGGTPIKLSARNFEGLGVEPHFMNEPLRLLNVQ